MIRSFRLCPCGTARSNHIPKWWTRTDRGLVLEMMATPMNSSNERFTNSKAPISLWITPPKKKNGDFRRKVGGLLGNATIESPISSYDDQQIGKSDVAKARVATVDNQMCTVG